MLISVSEIDVVGISVPKGHKYSTPKLYVFLYFIHLKLLAKLHSTDMDQSKAMLVVPFCFIYNS